MHHSNGSPTTGTARETFLNYFFGQNGPGPIAGASVDRHTHNHSPVGVVQAIVPVGRDVSAPDSSKSSGLLAGKRNLDGNNAAFDMKSLGKHIEAVSHLYPEKHIYIAYTLIDSFRRRPSYHARRNGN
jgi:dynamin 1-like protein